MTPPGGRHLLVEGKGKKAYSEISLLLEDMTHSLVSGPGIARVLATAAVLRAVAAVQAGWKDEGVWHWQVARQLYPAVEEFSLSAYGDVGPFLKSQEVRDPEREELEKMFRGAFPSDPEVDQASEASKEARTVTQVPSGEKRPCVWSEGGGEHRHQRRRFDCSPDGRRGCW